MDGFVSSFREAQSHSPKIIMDENEVIAPVEGVEAEEEATEAPAEEAAPAVEADEEAAA